MFSSQGQCPDFAHLVACAAHCGDQRLHCAGDTEFLEGGHVDKNVFRDENNRIARKGGTPASAEPLTAGAPLPELAVVLEE